MKRLNNYLVIESKEDYEKNRAPYLMGYDKIEHALIVEPKNYPAYFIYCQGSGSKSADSWMEATRIF